MPSDCVKIDSKLDLEEVVGDAPNVSVSYLHFRRDRRTLKSWEREQEESHLVVRAEVALDRADPRLPEVARALVEALARFGL